MNNNLPWDIIIAKIEGISLSEEEQSQLQNWLAADNKNKLLFDELNFGIASKQNLPTTIPM